MVKGDGTVIGVSNNHIIIARFTDELNNHPTVLSCAVQQGDIRTDTVWEPHAHVTKFDISGDGSQVNSNSDSVHGNSMSISAKLIKELDGVTLYCGSHAHPRQAKFEFHIKGNLSLFRQCA